MPGLNLMSFVNASADKRKRLLNEWETKRRIDIYQGELDVRSAQQKQNEWYQKEVQTPYMQGLTNKISQNTQFTKEDRATTQAGEAQAIEYMQGQKLIPKGLTPSAIRQIQELAKAFSAGMTSTEELSQGLAETRIGTTKDVLEAQGAGAVEESANIQARKEANIPALTAETTAAMKGKEGIEVRTGEEQINLMKSQEVQNKTAAQKSMTEAQQYFTYLDSQVATGVMSQEDVDREKMDYWMTKVGARKEAPELVDNVLGLMSAQAALKSAGITQAPADFSKLYGSIDPNTLLLLQKFQGRVVSEKDIAAAMKIIGDQAKVYQQIMEDRKISLPLGIKSNGEIVYHEARSGVTEPVLSPRDQQNIIKQARQQRGQ